MDERIHFVGAMTADHLTPQQRETLITFVSAQPPTSLVAVKVFPNFSTSREDDTPNGMIAYYNPEARVDAGVLPEALFQVMQYVKVPGKSESFEVSTENVNAALDQTPQNRFNDAVRHRYGSIKNKDRSYWNPEVGGRDGFAGVFKINSEDGRQHDYYVTARGTVPQYVAQFKKMVAEKTPTWNDLERSPEWIHHVAFGVDGAKRNAGRAMAQIAEACTMDVCRTDDARAYITNPNIMHPETVIPDATHPTHSIASGHLDGNAVVAIYYDVIPLHDCIMQKDAPIFVAAGPYDGLYGFPIGKHDKLVIAGGLPASSGRTVTTAESLPRVSSDFVWEGKNARHADLHQEAFRVIDKNFRKQMNALGWRTKDMVQRMVPVAVKLYADEQ